MVRVVGESLGVRTLSAYISEDGKMRVAGCFPIKKRISL